MIYKTLQKVSNVCQLLDKSKFPATQTINGVKFTNNGDGTITVNGTATSTAFFLLFKYLDSLIPKHKYLLSGSPNDASVNAYIQCYDDTNFEWLRDVGGGAIAIFPKQVVNLSGANNIRIRIAGGYTANNLVFKPQLFDLTEMYGAGHEPTTVEEFRQDFPEEMYDYSPHCFITSYKNCLKVSDVCQLLDKSKYPATTTKAGITFTNNGDGTITLNGTSTDKNYSEIYLNIEADKIILGHTFLFTGVVSGTFLLLEYSGGYTGKPNNAIFEATEYKYTRVRVCIRVGSGVTVSNIILKPQLFDLTEMYGAGNEPTTVDQFRADFPEELYDYKPYSIIPSYKKSLVCKTKNLFDIPLTRGYPSDTASTNTTSRTFTVGTYVVGMSRNNYYFPNTIIDFIIDKNRIKLTIGRSNGYGISIPLLLTVGNTYTLSCKSDNNEYPSIGITYYKKDGTVISYSGSVEKITNTPEITFTVPENTYYTLILFYGRTGNEYTFSNIQLEEGSTATEYHPYGYL